MESTGAGAMESTGAGAVESTGWSSSSSSVSFTEEWRLRNLEERMHVQA